MLNYKENCLEEILSRSSKLVTLIDLAGDHKYMKTTIHGVSALKPHYVSLLINGRSGVSLMTKVFIFIFLVIFTFYIDI